MNSPDSTTRLTRGQLAREAGVNFATVCYYERRGLLQTTKQAPNGYHHYTVEAVQRLRFIKRAQELGFSLKEVEALMELSEQTNAPCSEARERAEAKVIEMKRKIEDLQRMKQAVEQLVERCRSQGNANQCPILDSLHGEMAGSGVGEPSSEGKSLPKGDRR